MTYSQSDDYFLQKRYNDSMCNPCKSIEDESNLETPTPSSIISQRYHIQIIPSITTHTHTHTTHTRTHTHASTHDYYYTMIHQLLLHTINDYYYTIIDPPTTTQRPTTTTTTTIK